MKQSTASISETAADIIHNFYDLGIAMGAIQVPGDGPPIVLMADRQSTGGYPKIATVIGPDLGRLAQARPGTTFRFDAVSIEEAVAARRPRGRRAGAGRRAAIACASQP
ncbi:allophanate hydrolase subunit 2 [Bradyrhizobium elkanii]|nr:allophanate hydrolase subunit 2 [Bradyrhizobium elkanii]